MDDIGILGILAFFCLFNVIGGAALGNGLRGLLKKTIMPSLFFVIWGGFFGGIPLVMGLAFFATQPFLWPWLIQIAVMGGAAVTTFVWGDQAGKKMSRFLSNPAGILLFMGMIFTSVGGSVTTAFLALDVDLVGALIGSIFLLIGAIMLSVALFKFVNMERMLELFDRVAAMEWYTRSWLSIVLFIGAGILVIISFGIMLSAMFADVGYRWWRLSGGFAPFALAFIPLTIALRARGMPRGTVQLGVGSCLILLGLVSASAILQGVAFVMGIVVGIIMFVMGARFFIAGVRSLRG